MLYKYRSIIRVITTSCGNGKILFLERSETELNACYLTLALIVEKIFIYAPGRFTEPETHEIKTA